jgi:D-arabinose 1-dehydrogenase-like Zn-dependent alcohol dehydrogenase
VPAAGEVLVRVGMAGLCGTDYGIWSGERRVAYPLIPGHEFVGHVQAVGAGVSRVGVGDRVAIEPNYSCGACPLCREGNRNLCLARMAIGIDVDGCFAETVRVPERCCWAAPPGAADEGPTRISCSRSHSRSSSGRWPAAPCVLARARRSWGAAPSACWPCRCYAGEAPACCWSAAPPVA